jgi:tetratricopeptide (TPR) repeat protein
MMVDSAIQRDPVERLAEEFASRCRRGDAPSVADYVERYPQYADQIRELFPAVAVMEQFRAVETFHRETAFKHTAHATPPRRIGDFRIIREIGRGGMGIVYEAEQESLGRHVAVKVLPKHVLLAERHLRQFEREAQTAARLHHTNIVPVFGVGEQDGLHYYVMQLIHGVGLDEIIRRPCGPGRDLWPMVARTGIQAAEALEYAHQQGTFHCDVKPSNLLIDKDGVVWVADFGLARAVGHPQPNRTSDVAGTPRYMAPEQTQGKADPRSDIYALGATLYELLTRRPALARSDDSPGHRGPPFAAGPLPPRKINRAIPRDLQTAVMKCLAADPSKRYQTAAAVADDLKRFLDGRPLRARRASAIERTWRWCRRNPILAAVSVLAALLLAAVVFTATSAYVHNRNSYAQTARAYAETKSALSRVEATSELAVDALDDIYRQLSPDRIRISSGRAVASDAYGELPTERPSIPVQASNEIAALLDSLLVFYDRLAEQAPNNAQVILQSAIASRRVGDIRQRLGQVDHAGQEYSRTIERLSALGSVPDLGIIVQTELARSHNELGNVFSSRNESRKAYQSHRAALAILRSTGDTQQADEQYRYELARTLYFLAGKRLSGLQNRRGDKSPDAVVRPRPRHYRSSEYRDSAIAVLDALVREHPENPDYRFLLALCHRQAKFSHRWGRDGADVADWQQSVQTLEQLANQYPDVADYRYELSVTDAENHLGLFPWERRTATPSDAEQSLLKALDQSNWLVAHNPNIAEYARTQAVILARLATVYWRTGRLADAAVTFEEALERQSAVLATYPELPSHNRVVLEFFRLRLGQVQFQRAVESGDQEAMDACREVLEVCIENLNTCAQDARLADDRLLHRSLPIAYDTLSELLSEMGERVDAEEAGAKRDALSRR